MPREIRIIIFDRSEIGAALYQFLVGRSEISDLDEVQVASLGENGPLSVDLEISRGTARSTRTITGQQLAAAMIMYCIRRRIPLPHKTPKFLKPVAAGVGLTFGQGIGPADFDLVLHENRVLAS